MIKKISCFIILLSFVVSATAQIKKDSSLSDLNNYFKRVKWRSIGPFRGGRSVTATGVPGNINTYYMGTTGGGLWKTEDMGITWNNISDGFFKTGSVGAVSVAESDANVVYVGMGEHAVRGVMTSSGDGVYKSTDAGKSWKKRALILPSTLPGWSYIRKILTLFLLQHRVLCTANQKNVVFINQLTAVIPGKMYCMWMIKQAVQNYQWI